MSNGLLLLARCQPSIFACKVSRTASSSRFFGARFWTIAARPAQNASGVIPVLGVASLAMKSNKTGAIFSPWASIRSIMSFSDVFLGRNRGAVAVFRGKKRDRRQTAAPAPFSAKARGMRRPLASPYCLSKRRNWEVLNIGRQIERFVEQNTRLPQHPFDRIGRLGHGVRVGVDGQFARCRRLVVVADPGEAMQRAGARLGIMT